jgi:hypothetical protein
MYQDNQNRASASRNFFRRNRTCPADTAFLADLSGFSQSPIADGRVLLGSFQFWILWQFSAILAPQAPFFAPQARAR